MTCTSPVRSAHPCAVNQRAHTQDEEALALALHFVVASGDTLHQLADRLRLATSSKDRAEALLEVAHAMNLMTSGLVRLAAKIGGRS